MKNLLRISLIILIIFLSSCADSNKEVSDLEEEPKLNEYGFLTDTLQVVKEVVKNNETLTDIFLPYHFTNKDIYILVDAIKDSFDVRGIKSGKNYSIFYEEDSLKTPYYFVYEYDPVNYAIISLQDSIYAYSGKKEITSKERIVEGIIESSLYECLMEQNASPKLAMKMADIFAWTIDFYGIQKGDNFKVIYDEQFIDTQFVGVGNVYAAVFNHKSKDYFGFYFNQNDELDYFDEKGNSLRKAFLKAPLKFSRITSRFSKRRFHPVLKKYRPHLGTDYGAPTGTPIHTIGDGTVTEIGRKRGYGKYVKIKHNSTYSTAYHMSRFVKGMKRGDRVRQGETIGYVGSTGLSSGPHVDLRFWKNGQLVNFLNEEFPPSKPIDENYVEQFDSIKTTYINKLYNL